MIIHNNLDVFEFEILIKKAMEKNENVFFVYESIYRALTDVFENQKLIPTLEI